MLKQEEFGRLLAEARKGKEMTRREVAVALALDVGFVGCVERGTRSVSLLTLVGLHALLGFDSNALIDALVVSVAPLERRRRKVPTAVRALQVDAMPSFGELLTQARVLTQVTQAAVARAIRCSRRQVIRFEADEVLPSLVRFAQLWRVLGFDVNLLLATLHAKPPPREPFYGFGQVLTAARVGRSMSRRQVAQAARCAIGDYLALEYGAALPTMATAVRIHSITEFDADAALGWVWQSGVIEKLA